MPRRLKPCGTEAAARRHVRHGEPVCEACRAAELQAQRRRKGSRPRATVKCGTISGYGRHGKLGEKPCEACRLTWNAYCRGRRAARKAGA